MSLTIVDTMIQFNIQLTFSFTKWLDNSFSEKRNVPKFSRIFSNAMFSFNSIDIRDRNVQCDEDNKRRQKTEMLKKMEQKVSFAFLSQLRVSQITLSYLKHDILTVCFFFQVKDAGIHKEI